MKDKRRTLIGIIVFLVIVLLIIMALVLTIVEVNKNDEKNIYRNANDSIANNNVDNNNNIILSDKDLSDININSENSTLTNITEDEGLEAIEYNKILNVKNQTYFYTVQNCIKIFVENNDEYKKQIKENHDISFIGCDKMVQLQIEKNQVIRYGARVLFSVNQKPIYVTFIVYLDYINLTYSVEHFSGDFNEIKTENLNKDINSIKENEYNKYTYEVINSDDLIDKYFDMLGYLEINMPDIAYEYLDETCKEKNFGTLEEFKKYITNNEKVIRNIKIKEYKMIDNDNYIQYVCTDDKNNTYKISEFAIMQFKITIEQ